MYFFSLSKQTKKLNLKLKSQSAKVTNESSKSKKKEKIHEYHICTWNICAYKVNFM